jgi:plasmid maintenance system killer protein
MWQVLEHRRVVRRLAKTPTEILKRYEQWKDIVTISGPQGLRRIKGFHDETLGGEWKGHRSSRLGDQFSVIYRVEAQNVAVKVIDLTARDYRRKGK